jgi:hypothetical protein
VTGGTTLGPARRRVSGLRGPGLLVLDLRHVTGIDASAGAVLAPLAADDRQT